MNTHQQTDSFSIADDLWARIEPLLPVPQPKPAFDIEQMFV